jgi:hypothetical protein
MPSPTREQFEAAAAKVAATAPAGLTQEQFFAKIDEELAAGAAAATPPAAPPSASGFLGNAADDAMNIAGSLPGALGRIVAHPVDSATAIPVGILNRIRDVGRDMHPIDALASARQGKLMQAAGQFLPVGEAYQRPASMAADIMAGGSLARGAKSLIDAPKAIERAGLESRVDRYAPNKSVYTNDIVPKFGDAAAPSGGPIVEPHAPNISGYKPGFGAAADPHPSPFIDPYMANKSGYQPGGGFGEAANPSAAGPQIDIHSPNTSGYRANGGFGPAADPIHGSPIDIHAPNISGYRPDGGFGEAATAGGGPVVDRYMPNTSPEFAPTDTPTRPYGFHGTAPDDAIYEALREKLGGHGPAEPPADSYTGRLAASTEDSGPNWHSGATEPAERNAATNLHREDRALSDRFSHLIDDPSGSVLLNQMMHSLAMEALNKVRKSVAAPAAAAARAGGRAAEVANVGRYSAPR